MSKLRELIASATPGPWFAGGEVADDNGVTTCVSIGPYDVIDKPLAHHVEDTIAEAWNGEHDAESNAALIVALVNHAEAIDELIEAARVRAKRGHGEYCASLKALDSSRPCSCGHDLLAAALAKVGDL